MSCIETAWARRQRHRPEDSFAARDQAGIIQKILVQWNNGGRYSCQNPMFSHALVHDLRYRQHNSSHKKGFPDAPGIPFLYNPTAWAVPHRPRRIQHTSVISYKKSRPNRDTLTRSRDTPAIAMIPPVIAAGHCLKLRDTHHSP